MLDIEFAASMLKSPERTDRIQILRRIKDEVDKKGDCMDCFDLVRNSVLDLDNECRWQSLIIIGEFIESHADDVWSIVLEHARTSDDDMKDALATTLLEHLLEFDFQKFVNQLRIEILDRKNLELGEIVLRCWPFGKTATANWREVEDLVHSLKH